MPAGGRADGACLQLVTGAAFGFTQKPKPPLKNTELEVFGI
jgi:hypothetical protein